MKDYGHANPYWEKTQAKDDTDMLVSLHAMAKQADNLGLDREAEAAVIKEDISSSAAESMETNETKGGSELLKNQDKNDIIEPEKDLADGVGKSNIFRADERIDKSVEKVETEVTIGGKAKVKIEQMGADQAEMDTLTSKWEKHVDPKNFDRIGKVEIINSPLEDLVSAMGVRGYYNIESRNIVLTRTLSIDKKIETERMAETSLHEIGHHAYSALLTVEERNEVSKAYDFLKKNIYPYSDTKSPSSEEEWFADCAKSHFSSEEKLKSIDDEIVKKFGSDESNISVSRLFGQLLGGGGAK